MKAKTKKIYCCNPLAVVEGKINGIEIIYTTNLIDEVADSSLSTCSLRKAFASVLIDNIVCYGYFGKFCKNFNKEFLETKGTKAFIVDKEGKEFFCTIIGNDKEIEKLKDDSIISRCSYYKSYNIGKKTLLDSFIIEKKYIDSKCVK
jgi:hypothetical protein